MGETRARKKNTHKKNEHAVNCGRLWKHLLVRMTLAMNMRINFGHLIRGKEGNTSTKSKSWFKMCAWFSCFEATIPSFPKHAHQVAVIVYQRWPKDLTKLRWCLLIQVREKLQEKKQIHETRKSQVKKFRVKLLLLRKMHGSPTSLLF